jgi:hypothetical protein
MKLKIHHDHPSDKCRAIYGPKTKDPKKVSCLNCKVKMRGKVRK